MGVLKKLRRERDFGKSEFSKWKVGLERVTAQHVFLFDSGNISFFNEKEIPIQQKILPRKHLRPSKSSTSANMLLFTVKKKILRFCSESNHREL